MRLDFGGSSYPKEGFRSVDMNPKADIVCDLDSYPFEVDDNHYMAPDSVDEMRCIHTIEHLKEPFEFMRECYRVAKDGCLFEIRIPWWQIDMMRNPAHRHFFHPDWFRNLDATRPCWGGGMDHMRRPDWVVRNEIKVRHRFFPWKVVEYRVWLVARKS